jgi:hypothetical protein
VKRAATTIAISTARDAAEPSVVVVTARVSPEFGGVPTGSVTFSTSKPIGTASLVIVNGGATATVRTTDANVEAAVVANYGGDKNFTGSTTQQSQSPAGNQQ